MGDVGDRAKRAGQQAADRGEQAGEAIQQSKPYQALVALGLVSYGIVHLLIAWIALQLAWGLGSGDASNTGALRQLAAQPFGNVLLIIVAVGLFALTLWQLLEAAIGHTHIETPKRYARRAGSVGKAIIYLLLGISAARAATGGAQSDSNASQESASAQLLALPFGQALVVLAGAVILGIGVAQIVKGVRRSFRDDLDGAVPQWALRLGTAGYVAKGVALGIVGALFAWAGISYDPGAAGGMDDALRTLLDQPFGPFLLSALALGLACFGVYCFVWARNARHEKA
ncbi:hypothetical protein GGQ54_000005 [Naumannella cuiyingiana]|uniref:DUF1206 domain-containing protein n=1 Tax=Naumannella cuiyingiana TaxID=1347891 RepID=A0A7Z0D5U9_9ACTN|nr:DUF1206 domain-containing protein [Naumannella cuiyingiana]NYI69445.1 hypothetical protein [Naumannella cuiyingiana]